MSEDGSTVNYREMGGSQEFQDYVQTTRLLRGIHLEDLSQPEVS